MIASDENNFRKIKMKIKKLRNIHPVQKIDKRIKFTIT